MHLISVNRGTPQTIAGSEKVGSTGIFKQPVTGRVQIGETGLSGDAVLDKKHHGGPDQAIYVYGAPDYAWWSETLGCELLPGTFGDNLTIAGLESATIWVGDTLRVGEVLLQVTAPRIPCGTLAARMGDRSFVKRFRAAERPGLYCRVLQSGWVQAGDPVQMERYRGDTISVLDMFRAYYDPDPSEDLIHRHLAAPIAIRSRAEMEENLQKAQAKKQA
jgi:MOSC domain-containing protein YiiM